MTNTEITAFLTQNRATKAKAIVEILTKDDAAACLAAALQLLPGDDREPVVELIVGLADIPTIRDALAIHAPNWGGAAAREMGRRAVRGDEVAVSVIGAIAKADDGNGVAFAECFIDDPPLSVRDVVEILSNDTHPHTVGKVGVIKRILRDRPGYGANPVDVVEVGTDDWGVFLPVDQVRRASSAQWAEYDAS